MPCNLSLDGTDFPVRSDLIKSSPLTHCQGPKFRGVDLRGVDVHGLKESSGCPPRSEKDKDYKPSVRKKICHLLKKRFLSLNPHAEMTTSANPEKDYQFKDGLVVLRLYSSNLPGFRVI